MSTHLDGTSCAQSDLVLAHALQALPPREARAVEDHLAGCEECRRQMDTFRPIVDGFAGWPTDVLRPSASLWDRLAERVGLDATSDREPAEHWTEPEWEEVAPGISVKLLATDRERDRVSMLVRLAPGTDYPPHRHAGVEELHLLHGELWIDDRKLSPGDFSRAEPGSVDRRVWSETGCTCVLVTSPSDLLR
jgi:anti-sigma factor ChrR (cupin superfamily)